MTSPLLLRHEAGRHLEIATATGALLWRYVYAPDVPANESPRPYAHPVCSAAGDVLTNFRPNDHPWHHALSLAIASVGGVNFWGGPSHRRADGYQWRADHGVQRHTSWLRLVPEDLLETVDWLGPRGEPLLAEARRLRTEFADGGWALRWTSELRNTSGRGLALENYHSLGGLEGSHYTGLQFRGARDLLDDHGDAAIGIAADGGLAGEAAVHGTASPAMEWTCQHDTTLRRTRVRFENVGGPLPWFVRRKNPLAAFAFHREAPVPLGPGALLRLDHRLTFAPA